MKLSLTLLLAAAMGIVAIPYEAGSDVTDAGPSRQGGSHGAQRGGGQHQGGGQHRGAKGKGKKASLNYMTDDFEEELVAIEERQAGPPGGGKGKGKGKGGPPPVPTTTTTTASTAAMTPTPMI